MSDLLARYEPEAAQADVLVELSVGDWDCRGLSVRITRGLVFPRPVCALDVLSPAVIVFVAHLQLGADRLPRLLIHVIDSHGVGRPWVRLGSHRDGGGSIMFGGSTGSRSVSNAASVPASRAMARNVGFINPP